TELWDGKNHPAIPPAGWRDECWENIVTELESIFMASSAQFEEGYWGDIGVKLYLWCFR
ncbi:MAG: hypothetical protein GX280_05175, partial [Lentisphaerae bacterium]|nr:hypothetical protein [Lentisphaerota bacterium]